MNFQRRRNGKVEKNLERGRSRFASESEKFGRSSRAHGQSCGEVGTIGESGKKAERVFGDDGSLRKRKNATLGDSAGPGAAVPRLPKKRGRAEQRERSSSERGWHLGRSEARFCSKPGIGPLGPRLCESSKAGSKTPRTKNSSWGSWKIRVSVRGECSRKIRMAQGQV